MRSVLRDAAIAVKVSICVIGQHLRQAGVQVKGVVGGDGFNSLLQAVSQAIVDVAGHGLGANDGSQAVGGVIRVCADAITEQIAAGIPNACHDTVGERRICHTIDIGQMMARRRRSRRGTRPGLRGSALILLRYQSGVNCFEGVRDIAQEG